MDVTALANAIKEMLEGPDDFEDWDDLDGNTPYSCTEKYRYSTRDHV